MKAQWPGKCTACGESFDEGDEIERDDDDGGWCHEDCKE